jgi:PAS domain S-box-containing protein
MSKPIRVLLLEDEPADAELLIHELCRAGFKPEWKRVETEPDFLAEIKNLPDIILSDYSMPQFSASRASELLRESGLNIPFILISGAAGEDAAVEAMQHGATDYLLKDRIGRLGVAVDRALARNRLRNERDQAEEAQHTSEARYSALFECAPDGILIADANIRYLDANASICRMLGYSRDELLGMSAADILVPSEVQRIAPAVELIKARSDYHDEWRFRRKDGSVFEAEVIATQMPDGNLLGMIRDITGRKRVDQKAAAALHELNDVKAALDEHAIVAITDARGKITYVNDKFCAISKYKREELLGQDHRIINSGFHPKEFIGGIWQTIGAGRVWKGEIKNKAKDGTFYWVDTTIVPYLGENGKPIQYIAIRADITDRKRADEKAADALHELNDVKAALDEHAIVAITDAKGRITYVNDKFCAISKYSREELVGKDHRIINSGFHPKEFIQDIWQTIGAGRVWKGEIKNKAKDGTFYWVDTTIVPYLGGDGKPIQYIAIRADITERKRFEQALQQTNAELENAKFVAEKANLAKSEFLSSMSHELRTPLNAILGFAQLMESAAPPPNASQTKNIAHILHAGWYLLELINEVLDLSVIESGKLSLSKESVSLPGLMSECQDMMEAQAQQRGIRMTFPRFDEPVFVNADLTRLKQIVINLVSNAIKYNHEHGTVVVNCTLSDPERVRISVKDTGAGLPPEKLAQLFQPFNRLGQEAGGVPGTGIGLFVSKRLVELMGGVIGVESTVGVGSTFWCELSSAAAPEVAVGGGEIETLARPEAPANAPWRKLLYVEDNPANLELVEELIGRFPDLGLLTAANGTLGIKLARATQPRLILLDINLPGINGFKVLEILRKDPTTAHIPVVALSANAMPRDIEKGLQAGFFRYLTKPIKINEFMDTLGAALEFAEESVAQNA